MSILHNFISMVLLLTFARERSSQYLNKFEINNFLEVSNEIDYRLPTYIVPSHYAIKLEPDLNPKKLSFKGKTFIKINVLVGNKKTITLHAKYLEFDENYTTLVSVNMRNQTWKPTTHSINGEKEFLTLHFQTPIAVGSYWLNFKFTGRLNNSRSRGFYSMTYDNENGEQTFMGATQFQPTYARQALPCFDEPAMKAIFTISIKHLSNYTVISNMPVKKKVKDITKLEKTWTLFHDTPVMSTYLVAFVVSNFKNMTSEDGTFSCWTQQNKLDNCRYALETGQKELKAFNNYLSSGYGVPKIDNVAIPSLCLSAMENWGLITYREKKLLYVDGVTTTSEEEQIAMTMSHEFAHLWFGNLVSPAWWDNTWLNEGFANYFEYFITDKVNPDWRLMDRMVVENLHVIAFAVDEGSNRPLYFMVNSPSEIDNIFDTYIYNRGGCIVRMISHVLTESVFQTGIRQHITNHKYGVSTSNDLFDTLISTAENISRNPYPVQDFWKSWVNQGGYPVVHVNRLSASSGYVSFNQTKFLLTNTGNTMSTDLWWIPINYATQSNPNFNDTEPTHWLPPSKLQQEVPLNLSDNEWLIVNKQQTGFYRLNYDKHNWALIADYLNTPNFTDIHVLNRAQLLDDSFNLVQSEYLNDYTVFLNISRYLAQEDDFVPWLAAFHGFKILEVALQNSDTYDLFKLFILKLIEKVENKFGYNEMPEDDHVTKINREEFIKWACSMGSVKCVNATHQRLIEFITKSKQFSPDLKQVSLCAGIRTANVTLWNKIFDLYLKDKETVDNLILFALGCSSNPNIINSYLAKLINPDSKIRMKLPFLEVLWGVVAGNDGGADIILNFIVNNCTTLNTNVLEDWLTYFVIALSIEEHVFTDAQIKKLNGVLNGIPTEDRDHYSNFINIYRLVFTTTIRNSQWLNKYEPQIRSFLLSQNLI